MKIVRNSLIKIIQVTDIRNFIPQLLLLCLFIVGFEACRRSLPDPPVPPTLNSWDNTRDPAVLNYIHAENDYADAYFSGISDLRSILYTELTNRDGTGPINQVSSKDSLPLASPDGKYSVFNSRDGKVILRETFNPELFKITTYGKEGISILRKTAKSEPFDVTIYSDSTKAVYYTVVKKKYLVLFEEKSLKSAVRILDLTNLFDPSKGNRIGFNDLEGEVVFKGYEENNDKVLFLYSSPVTPPTMYTYDLTTHKLGIRWQSKINGYVKENYGTRTILVKANDGTAIPVSLMYHKDLEKRDGTSPLLLLPRQHVYIPGKSPFNPAWPSLLDRGFYIAYAPADADQYLVAANKLIADKYTARGLITGFGTDAALPIVSDAMNRNASLFKAVVLDLSGSTDGLGPAQSMSLKKTNQAKIKKQSYPAMLLFTGEGSVNDNAMAEMAARYRNSKTDGNILVLRTDKATAYDKKNPRDGKYYSVSEKLAFILHVYGIEK
ncbi:MAG: hypothetical protein M0P58_03585 [Bacteroidales bacterium]|nr:hypothetical protein [Bacteroidales bacterium]